jgi:hypothetical protein
VRDFGANVEQDVRGGGKADFARDQQAMQSELKRQMSVLAEVVWERYEERLEFLERCVRDAPSFLFLFLSDFARARTDQL